MSIVEIDLLSITRNIRSTATVSAKRNGSRMTIAPASGSGATIHVPYAPTEVDHQGLAGSFVSVTRPGMEDEMIFDHPVAESQSFNLTIADKVNGVAANGYYSGSGTTVSALKIVNLLKGYASKGTRVRVTYGAMESGLWYITSLSIKTMRRDPVTDELTVCQADITLTKVAGTVTGLGPVTGGAGTGTTATSNTGKTATKTYTTKPGDTLWAISIRFYGTGTKWTVIANANRITDPRKLPVDKALVIP